MTNFSRSLASLRMTNFSRSLASLGMTHVPLSFRGEAEEPALAKLKFQLVSNAVNRSNSPSVFRHALQLVAQVLDVAIDGAVRDDAMIGIQTIEQFVARPHFVGSLSERAQQSKLCGGQRQNDPIECRLVALTVDDETRMRCCRF